MEDNKSFRDDLEAAVASYRDYLDQSELVKVKEAARNYLSSFQAFYNVMLRKSLLHEDPYKSEIKISEVEAPESGPVIESEKVDKMSQRLSMFDSQLDFFNNYYQFSADFLTMPRLKRIKDLITYIKWESVSEGSPNMTTRILAELLSRLRQGSDNISTGVINDSIQQLDKNSKQILSVLKKVTIYQRERYKLDIRNNLLDTIDLKAEAIQQRREDVIRAIKRKFPQVLGDTPYFPELIEEILNEEGSYDKEEQRKKALERLQVQKKKENNKSQESFKPFLLDGCRILATAATPIEQAIRKLAHNGMVLAERPMSFGERFKKWVRSMVMKEEEKRIYEIELMDPTSGISRNVKINFDKFFDDTQKLARMLAVMGNKMSSTYKRLEGYAEEKLFEFLSGKIDELNKMIQQLPALDTYFKSEVPRSQRQMIRGIKIEVTSIKNAIVKANQKRHEYVSRKEEKEQLKKLGIDSGE
jgi:hypothetical protein